ncbi:hypothetical protein ACIP3U_09260 [[Kitasatospora] papulosa]|uniref:hypothetical protein n=1 Tax=[Kitasatospora] papulosa TaxID=1464011 RepID=UPI0037FECB2E
MPVALGRAVVVAELLVISRREGLQLAGRDAMTDHPRRLGHLLRPDKELVQHSDIQCATVGGLPVVPRVARGDVECLASDAVGVTELLIAVRLRVDGKQLEQGRQLHDPAVLGVQSLPSVPHHEAAGKDDLVASPVRVLDGLDLKPHSLEPYRGMILPAAELVRRESNPLIPLCATPATALESYSWPS